MEQARDEYVGEVLTDAYGLVTDLLTKTHPGTLVTLGLHRDEAEDRVETRFRLDMNPDIEYRYRQLVYRAGTDSGMSPHTVVSKMFAALVERIEFRRESEDGVIDLNKPWRTGEPRRDVRSAGPGPE